MVDILSPYSQYPSFYMDMLILLFSDIFPFIFFLEFQGYFDLFFEYEHLAEGEDNPDIMELLLLPLEEYYQIAYTRILSCDSLTSRS